MTYTWCHWNIVRTTFHCIADNVLICLTNLFSQNLRVWHNTANIYKRKTGFLTNDLRSALFSKTKRNKIIIELIQTQPIYKYIFFSLGWNVYKYYAITSREGSCNWPYFWPGPTIYEMLCGPGVAMASLQTALSKNRCKQYFSTNRVAIYSLKNRSLTW